MDPLSAKNSLSSIVEGLASWLINRHWIDVHGFIARDLQEAIETASCILMMLVRGHAGYLVR